MAQRRLAGRIDALLPQTQCTQCGFAGCAPYARSVAGGGSPPTLCKPGGSRVAREIAALVKCDINEMELQAKDGHEVARIDEKRCVGCYKCIEACPPDAIIGAHGYLHAVLADWCTGCGLCLEPCPTDCIELVAAPRGTGPAQRAVAASDPAAARAAAGLLRARYEGKRARPGLREPRTSSPAPAAELAAKAMARARRRLKK